MHVEIKKQVEKDTERLPIQIQLMAAKEIEKLKAANNLNELEIGMKTIETIMVAKIAHIHRFIFLFVFYCSIFVGQ